MGLSLRPDGMYQDNNEREIQGPPKRRKTNASAAPETPAVPTTANGIKQDGDEVKTEDNTKDGVKEDEEKEEEEIKNKFDEIPPSRTFLTTVSAKKCLIDWLDVDPMIQAALSRKEEHGMQTRMPDDPNFPPYGMMGNMVCRGCHGSTSRRWRHKSILTVCHEVVDKI